MCGRYASFLPAEALARIFGTVNPLPNLEQTWNMAPTRDAPVVRLSREGKKRLAYEPRRGAVISKSCTCCFQNFANTVVAWPLVSSLAGIKNN
jgi:hypothetical protein